MALPAASIIIPVRDLWLPTRRCLESVRRHTLPPHEVIVIDNASRPPPRRRLAALARSGALRLIRNDRNRSFAASINQGARLARGKIIVWLNNDAEVGPQWLERLAACLKRNPRAGAVGPCTNDPNSGRGRGAGHAPAAADFPAFAAAWAMRFDGQAEAVARLSGFCLAVRRRAAEAVGPLDERFLWGEEDEDYCLRLRRAGFRLLLARDVYVRHEGGGTRRRWTSARRRRIQAHNRDAWLAKWGNLKGRLRRDALAVARELR